MDKLKILARLDWIRLHFRLIWTSYTNLLSSAEKYFELLKERKVKGYLGQEKNRFGGESA
jgi:hypothetical protein